MSATFVEHTLRGSGVRLSAIEAGDRKQPSVLFVHGYPDTRDVWQPVLAQLADRYHVIAYDVRGAGRSEAPADLVGYDLAYLVEDALAVLDVLAPERRVNLVGHDWGSVQGWEFVSNPRSAERFASFTSISGPSLDYLGVRMRQVLAQPAAWSGLVEQAVRSWYVGALHLPGFPEGLWQSSSWWHPFAAFALGSRGGPSPTQQKDGVNGSGLYRQNVLKRLTAPRADAISRVPVQLVVPRRDPFLAPNTFDGKADWAPSLLRRDLDAGHWVPRTHPAVLADWIAQFVDDWEGGAP
ncbi:MAG TPA: alpha/beta fold hydrolase [Oscillatoriaceae cyanobacterium]